MMLFPSKRIGLVWPELNEGYTFRDFIKCKHAGLEMLQFYTLFHSASGHQPEWEARIARGQVAINGLTTTDPQRALRVGDILTYTRLPWREPDAPCNVDILYEDSHMVAISKPSGLQVLPAAMFHQRTVLTLLQHHYGQTAASATGPPPGTSFSGNAAGPPELAAEPRPKAASAAAGSASAGTAHADAAEAGTVVQIGSEPGPADGCQAAGAANAAMGCCDGAGAPPGPTQSGQGVAGAARRWCSAVEGVAVEAQGAGALRAGEGRGGGGGGTAAAGAARECDAGRQGGPKGAVRKAELPVPAPVHRLGRGTSGLLLCARTPEARRRLTELMTGKTAAAVAAAASVAEADSPQAEGETPLRKIYRALVQGIVAANEGCVNVPIGPINHPGIDGGLFAATPDGKPAKSVWRVLERRKLWRPDHHHFRDQHESNDTRDGHQQQNSEASQPRDISVPVLSAAEEEPVAAEAESLPSTSSAGNLSKGEAGGVTSRISSGVPRAEDLGRRWLSLRAEDKAATEDGATLMQVEILTGRPHQIRIHMAAMGHPLVGDPMYGVGGKPKQADLGPRAAGAVDRGVDGAPAGGDPHEAGFGRPGDCGYHLHSLELHLPHPISGSQLVLRASPPPRLMTAEERVLAAESLGAADPREALTTGRPVYTMLTVNDAVDG